MTGRLSRRGLFGKLFGDAVEAPSTPPPEPRLDPPTVHLDARDVPERASEPEPEPPWARRERARIEAQTASRHARITPFACIAASGCVVCVERCPEPGAVVVSNGRPRIDEARCTGCGACAEACPAPLRAIALLPRLPAPSGRSVR
jgi:Pyruvate/2-oxoacid:ferredoxin oxidoreductase delta subunit